MNDNDTPTRSSATLRDVYIALGFIQNPVWTVRGPGLSSAVLSTDAVSVATMDAIIAARVQGGGQA